MFKEVISRLLWPEQNERKVTADDVGDLGRDQIMQILVDQGERLDFQSRQCRETTEAC